jgi:gas vesicle protein GvpL/GvpF
MLYLYAIAADLRDVADLTGIQGEALALVRLDGALLVAGEVEATSPVDEAALNAQDALVRQLHERAAALLPMRFGSTATTQEDARRAIATTPKLLERLTAVRGAEQMIVRVLGERSRVRTAIPTEGSGARYLEALAEARRAPPELLAIAAAGRALQRDVRIEPAEQPGVIGSVYHLIDRGRADEYRALIDDAARGMDQVRVRVSGPSPAYAFA